MTTQKAPFGRWIAEPVLASMLLPNSPFYLINPITNPTAQAHFTFEISESDPITPNTEVWTFYGSHQPDDRNPYIKKECRAIVKGLAPAVRNLINSKDSSNF